MINHTITHTSDECTEDEILRLLDSAVILTENIDHEVRLTQAQAIAIRRALREATGIVAPNTYAPATPPGFNRRDLVEAIRGMLSAGCDIQLTPHQAEVLMEPDPNATSEPPISRPKNTTRGAVLNALAEHCSGEGLLGLTPADAFKIVPAIRVMPGMDDLARALLLASEAGLQVGFQVLKDRLVVWVGDLEAALQKWIWGPPPAPIVFHEETYDGDRMPDGLKAVSRVANWLLDQIELFQQREAAK